MKKIGRARTLVALTLLLIACIGLAFHTGTGTYSSFGIGQFFLLCPLGGIEALLASKTFIPQAIISLIVVLAISLFVGKSWCAWGCPIPLIRKVAGKAQPRPQQAIARVSLKETFKSDKRLWVLAGFLIAVLVVGFPVFCLICPIGLTFGTVASVWRLIQFNDVNLGLLLFPAALVVEILVIKTWCINICPIAGLLALCGRAAKGFRPKVDKETCLRVQGGNCHECFKHCPETIDLHDVTASAQLADCSRCGDCASACPVSAISMPVVSRVPETIASKKETEYSKNCSGLNDR